MDEIKRAIEVLGRGEVLGQEEIKVIFSGIMSGGVEKDELKEFLSALKDKETPEIIAGAAEVMRAKMVKIDARDCPDEVILDTCGTGGSSFPTFNISTAAAFVVAGCGIKVAKHGNRAVSSRFGSADVLQELGLDLERPPQEVCRIIRKTGIGFLFAPLYHPAMKYAAAARRELAARTIFNILGPLCNPAGADVQVLGVYEPRLLTLVAAALKNLGCRRAFVVYSPQGLDEISIAGETAVVELNKGETRSYVLTPGDFGIRPSCLSDIAPGGDARENARMVLGVLRGEESARANAVLINTAVGIVAAGKAEDFKQAVSLARQAIGSGAALKRLEDLIAE